MNTFSLSEASSVHPRFLNSNWDLVISLCLSKKGIQAGMNNQVATKSTVQLLLPSDDVTFSFSPVDIRFQKHGEDKNCKLNNSGKNIWLNIWVTISARFLDVFSRVSGISGTIRKTPEYSFQHAMNIEKTLDTMALGAE